MPHYLTRAVLDRNAPEQALLPLLDPADTSSAFDAHHRLMWTLFPGSDARRDFLWRADGKGRFLILSAREPRQSGLFRPLESKVFAPVLTAGDRLGFVLRVNATKDRRSSAGDDVVPGTRRKPSRNRRVDIVMDAMHAQGVQRGVQDPESRAAQRMNLARNAAQAWFTSQGTRRGFSVNTLTVDDYQVVELKRRDRRRATFGVLGLSGLLTVQEPEVFTDALVAGFGRAKAYGCGLMLLRRV